MKVFIAGILGGVLGYLGIHVDQPVFWAYMVPVGVLLGIWSAT